MVIETLTKGGVCLGRFKDRRSDYESSPKSAVNPNEPVNGARVPPGPVHVPGFRRGVQTRLGGQGGCHKYFPVKPFETVMVNKDINNIEFN